MLDWNNGMKNNEINILQIIAKPELSKFEQKYFKNNIQNFFDYKFFSLLEKHKIQFLLYKHLLDNNLLALQDLHPYIISLGERFVFLQSKYNEYIDILKKITEQLNNECINYTVLKGFSLIHDFYTFNNSVFRNFNDIDFLIDKSNISVFNDILVKSEFIQGILSSDYTIIPADKKEILYWRLNSHQEHDYIKPSIYSNLAPQSYLSIDLNFSIFKGGKYDDPIPTEKLLESRRLHKIDNFQFYSLGYTEELLQLCYHFYKDLNYDNKIDLSEDINLIKFSDIRLYIINNKDKIDWEKFMYMICSNNIYDEIEQVMCYIMEFYNDNNINEVVKKYFTNDNYKLNWDKILTV